VVSISTRVVPSAPSRSTSIEQRRRVSTRTDGTIDYEASPCGGKHGNRLRPKDGLV